jgi:hypothetical protein
MRYQNFSRLFGTSQHPFWEEVSKESENGDDGST